jgi:hypothetical protein
MATTYYLKNTSGSTVTVADIGVQLPNNQSIQIDHNAINGWLTNQLASALNAGTLVLSITDIGDVGGDFTGAEAIRALTITSYHDTDNPHETTISQTITADTSAPPITLQLLKDLTDAARDVDVSDPIAYPAGGLHNHNSLYWTKIQLGTDNHATVHIDWANITNAPSFGSPNWEPPVQVIINNQGPTAPSNPTTNEFWLNTTSNHIEQWNGTTWVDEGAPTNGERIIDGPGGGGDILIYNTTNNSWNPVAPEVTLGERGNTPPSNPTINENYLDTQNNHIYQWNGTTWVDQGTPTNGEKIIDDAIQPAQVLIYNSTTNTWDQAGPQIDIGERGNNPPSTPTNGEEYVDTDNGHVYIYNGTTWVDQGAPTNGDTIIDNTSQPAQVLIYNSTTHLWEPGGPAVVVESKSPTPPSNPTINEQYLNTTDNHIYQWDGTNWIDQGAPTNGETIVDGTTNPNTILTYNSSTDTWITSTPTDGIVNEKGDNPPSTPTLGETYLNNTNNHIYQWNGTTWVDQGGPTNGESIVDSSNRPNTILTYNSTTNTWITTTPDSTIEIQGGNPPASPVINETYLDNSNNHIYKWDGTNWIDQGAPTNNETIVDGSGKPEAVLVYNLIQNTWNPIVPEITIADKSPTPPLNPTPNEYYLNTTNNHLYEWNGTNWVDQGPPTNNETIIDGSGTQGTGNIETYNSTTNTWVLTNPTPDTAVIVNNDGDGQPAEYIFNSVSNSWVKLADINWGEHNALGGRSAEDSHPATAISYDNSVSHINATNVQVAIDQMVASVGVLVSNYVVVAKDGSDASIAGEVRGGFETPFLTVQAAITAIPTIGIGAASSGNRYAVWMAPGDYNENVVLNKAWVYIVADQNGGTELLSSTGNTLTLSSTVDSSTGVYGLKVISNSSNTTDNAIFVTGSNPIIISTDALAPSGARAIYFDGAHNQFVRGSTFVGPVRIDAGTIQFLESRVDGLTNVTNGNLRVIDGYFNNNGGDAIAQTGGTVTLVSAKLISGSGSIDYNQTAGTVYWGWVEYDHSSGKTVFSGTKTLLFPAGDLYFDNTVYGGSATTVQQAINNLFQQTSSMITPYIVGKDATDPYALIHTAIAQAVADGHGIANPAIILVKPGTYTEDVVEYPGINVISLMNDKAYQTKVNGTLTYSCTTGTLGNNLASWLGVDVSSGSPTVASLVFSGTAPQRLNVSNCEINSGSANPALEMNNSGTGSVLVNSNVNYNNISTGFAAKIDAGTFSLFKTQTVAMGNATAVQFNNAAQLQGMLNYSQGNLDFNGTSGGLFGQLTVANGTNPAIDFSCAASQLFLMDPIQTGNGAIKGGTHPENVFIHPNATDIYYNNTTSGLSSVTVQNAIDEIATEFGVGLDNIVWVAKNGNDSAVGVLIGTISNPFLTVQAAITSIVDAASTKVYIVMVMPGRYLENLTFKPWVNVCGISKEATVIATGSGTHSGTFSSGGRIALKDISFGGATQLMTFTHPASSPGGTSITIDNANIGTPLFNMLGGGVDYVQFRNDFYCAATTTVHSANLTAFNGIFLGGLRQDDTGCEHVDGYGSASTNTIKDCMGDTLNCVGNVWVEFYNNYSWSTLTSNGATCTVSYDAQSAPDTPAGLISLNGGLFQRTDNAFAIGFDKTIKNKLVAEEVQAAIDELTDKIVAFDIPQGTSFPVSPAPAAGDLFYRTDLNLTFQYDSSRSKWLSITQMFLDWGSNSADGKYLNIHGAAATQTGYLMPRNGTIIAVTAKCASGNQSKAFEIRKNNVGATPLKSFSLSSGSYSSINDNIDFSTTDYIQAFAVSGGEPARDAVVMIIIGWRG